MALHMRKSFIFFSSKNPSFLYKSHVSFSFSSLLFFSTSTKRQAKNTITVYDFLLRKHQFSPETSAQVGSVKTHIKNPEKTDSILSFLKECGFSKSQLERVVKSEPCLLSASLEKTIKPKIKIFQDLGFSAEDIAEIISNVPSILYRSLDNGVIPSLSVLMSLFGSSSEMAKVLKRYGWFLKHDLAKTMVPNIEFIKSCGVGIVQIKRHIYNFPRFFLHNPTDMKKFVEKVDDMGVYRSSGLFIHAVRVVSSMTNESWELKLKHFSNLGFGEDDILQMFKKSPPVFAVSQRKLKEVKEVLLATGKYDLSCIVKDPASFVGSVENKIKPRMQVLGILDSRNLIKKWPSLATITRMSESKFLEKFVQPYLNDDEVGGEVYSALNIKRNTKTEIISNEETNQWLVESG